MWCAQLSFRQGLQRKFLMGQPVSLGENSDFVFIWRKRLESLSYQSANSGILMVTQMTCGRHRVSCALYQLLGTEETDDFCVEANIEPWAERIWLFRSLDHRSKWDRLCPETFITCLAFERWKSFLSQSVYLGRFPLYATYFSLDFEFKEHNKPRHLPRSNSEHVHRFRQGFYELRRWSRGCRMIMLSFWNFSHRWLWGSFSHLTIRT